MHNFQSGKSSYWLIARQAPSPASTSPPGPVAGYTVTHVSVDGPRNSVQAVEDANKTASGVSGGHLEFTLAPGAANAEILAAADALSLHAITTGSRYIDAAGQVHNFQSGRSTYWLITKSEVNVAEPPALITAPLITPSYIGANTLALVGPIADQRLTKDVLYTSAVAFPAATGMDGTVIYSVADLPDGITLNAERKLTGTATALLTQTTLTYTATDTDTDIATLTFKISVSVAGDYDIDDDGLIEVANLAQLNAMRWDLDGDGAATGDALAYLEAFSGDADDRGCPTNDTDNDDNDCTGYELTADLDMDTNDVDGADAGDTYWNGGAGWAPIGHGTEATEYYNAEFDGNGHTISNLFISNAAATAAAGLFGITGPDADIKRVGLKDVNVSLGASTGGPDVGALVGTNGGTISYSYASGLVKQNATGAYNAGGLVGSSTGDITGSYALVQVNNTSSGPVGGLVGLTSGAVSYSYATGQVLVGNNAASAGGLVGQTASGVTIRYSYAAGAVGGTGGNNGGLLGGAFNTPTITASYWDTTSSGKADTGTTNGVGKTTSELQSVTTSASGNIYEHWGAAWDFGTTFQYPRIKADWDGDGTATAAEFGEQDASYD